MLIYGNHNGPWIERYAISRVETTKQFNDSSCSIFMVARKVVLNTSCFHVKVTLIYYKRTRNDLVVSLLQLLHFLFLALCFLSNETFEIYRHFSNVFCVFYKFYYSNIFQKSRIFVSLGSVEFLQFLHTTFWIRYIISFYLFVCLCLVCLVLDAPYWHYIFAFNFSYLQTFPLYYNNYIENLTINCVKSCSVVFPI